MKERQKLLFENYLMVKEFNTYSAFATCLKFKKKIVKIKIFTIFFVFNDFCFFILKML